MASGNDGFSIELTPEANADIDAIVSCISNELFNPGAALDWYDKFTDALKSLRQFPDMCPDYKTEKEYRALIVGGYIAFYRVFKENKLLIIFRVLFGAADYSRQL